MAIEVTQVTGELLYGVAKCPLLVTQLAGEVLGPCAAPYVPPPASTPSEPENAGATVGRPELHVGLRDSEPAVLRVGQTFLDDGVCYELLARTRRTAPAGAGGECIFTNLYVATTHFGSDVTLYLTAIVDGVRMQTQALVLLAADGSVEGETTVHELSLMEPYMVATVERLRHAPRGTWFEVEIAVRCGEEVVPAALIADEIEVEFEIVRESMQAVQAAAP